MLSIPMCDRWDTPRTLVSNILLLILLFSFSVPYSHILVVDASNWAQASGPIQQITVFPSIPSPANKHWQNRFGHCTILYTKPNPDAGVAFLGKVFLIGGDTNDGSFLKDQEAPGLVDNAWEKGYKNDVWVMDGTIWTMKGDIRLRTEYRQKIALVKSKLKWVQTSPGWHPEPGQTYEQWLSCTKSISGQYFFPGNTSDNLYPSYTDCPLCTPYNPYDRYNSYEKARMDIYGSYTQLINGKRQMCTRNLPKTHFSPRRHHAGVFFKGYLYVMGGRAREFVQLSEDRSIGGIMGPIVQDAPRVGLNVDQKMTTQREAIVVKSDVWRSLDGVSWELVTPGCKAPQASLLAAGNKNQGKSGLQSMACTKRSDCYSIAEDCVLGTCQCLYWSPREQHSVAVHGNFMYLSGGYATRLYSRKSNCGPYACGDIDASSYRNYMADLWRSPNGEIWELVSDGKFPGRGGHKMITVSLGGNNYLWIIGGRGGSNEGDKQLTYYNDMWSSPFFKADGTFPGAGDWCRHDDPACSIYYPGNISWSPRLGHSVDVEPPSPSNFQTMSIYLVGGTSESIDTDGHVNRTFYDDVWVWRPEITDDVWRQDFTPDALFSTGGGADFHYSNNTPALRYISPDSDVSLLQRYTVPDKFGKSSTVLKRGFRLRQKPYLTDEKLAMLNSVGIKTVRDLATADVYTILKLRGFDYPQVPKEARLNFYDVCDARALAIAVVNKCTVDTDPMTLYAGKKNQPWHIIPEFSNNAYIPTSVGILWHDRKNYNFLTAHVDDYPTLLSMYDGCTYNPTLTDSTGRGPNIDGIGYVQQVRTVQDPNTDLQDLFCIQTPGARAYHSSIFFEERLYLFGGKQSEQVFQGDTWYRDSKLPIARISDKPPTNTPYPIFSFTADEFGCVFEYKVWDPYHYTLVRPWTTVVQKTDIGWLSWRKNGPGNGIYRLYVRAIDAAGNRDERYVMNQNVYEWFYVSPTPWDIIAQGVFGFLALCFFGYMEYRRRVKKAAMERYAMKRMRRKFKAMQRDIDGRSVDWRSLYMESKEAEAEMGRKKLAKDKAKQRDKKADKREKEAKKREKEKEKIKKKLKSTKETQAVKKKEKPDISESPAKSEKKAKSKGKKGDEGDEQVIEKDGKKMKEYEVSAEEQGTKSRKSNKRYKDYELEGQDQEQKKDV